jgi:hypothetical protein
MDEFFEAGHIHAWWFIWQKRIARMDSSLLLRRMSLSGFAVAFVGNFGLHDNDLPFAVNTLGAVCRVL